MPKTIVRGETGGAEAAGGGGESSRDEEESPVLVLRAQRSGH